jgi:hypothetical protein
VEGEARQLASRSPQEESVEEYEVAQLVDDLVTRIPGAVLSVSGCHHDLMEAGAADLKMRNRNNDIVLGTSHLGLASANVNKPHILQGVFDDDPQSTDIPDARGKVTPVSTPKQCWHFSLLRTPDQQRSGVMSPYRPPSRPQ